MGTDLPLHVLAVRLMSVGADVAVHSDLLEEVADTLAAYELKSCSELLGVARHCRHLSRKLRGGFCRGSMLLFDFFAAKYGVGNELIQCAGHSILTSGKSSYHRACASAGT
jgi:hypothetical protein